MRKTRSTFARDLSQYDGRLKVARTISLGSTLRPYALTVDGSGRLYVAFADESATFRLGIAEYDSGARKPSAFFYFSPVSPSPAAAGAPVVDDSSGVLYQTIATCVVANSKLQCTSSILLFSRGKTTPSRMLNGPYNTVLGTPALDTDGNLYVQAQSPGNPVRTIQRYAKGTWSKTVVLSARKIFLGLAWPTVASSRSSLAGVSFGAVGDR